MPQGSLFFAQGIPVSPLTGGSQLLVEDLGAAGSAQGLYKLQYRPRSARDLGFTVRVKRSTIGAVTGPLRGTIVLGRDAAAGQSGACGVSVTIECTSSGSKLRCR